MSIRNRITQYMSSVLATRVRFANGERILGKSTAGAGYGSELTAAQARSLIGAEATMTAASQAEMEAGVQAAIRSMSPLRVAQAIAALATNVPDPTALTFAGADPNTSSVILSAADVRLNGKVLKFAGLDPYDDFYRWSESGRFLPEMATGEIQLRSHPSSNGIEIYPKLSNDVWGIVPWTEDVMRPWDVSVYPPTQGAATGNVGVAEYTTIIAVTATHLGQWCKATTAWWLWDGSAWIETFLLDGMPVAHKARHAIGGADALSPSDIGAADAETNTGDETAATILAALGSLSESEVNTLRTILSNARVVLAP